MIEEKNRNNPFSKINELPTRGKPFSGLSLRTKLIIGNLTITVIVIVTLGSFIFYRTSQSNAYLSDQYQLSVRSQTESNLVDIVEREARSQNEFFSNIKKNIFLIGKTAESLFEQEQVLGKGGAWNAGDSLIKLPQGSWDNPDSDVSSIFLPSFLVINENLISELNTLKQLDYSVPIILKENMDFVAIYFGGTKGETIYNPNIDLAGIVPHDFDVTTRPWYISASPQENPNRNTVWSIPYMDAALNGLVITCSIPVYDGVDLFRGVVAIDVKLNKIAEMASKIKIGETGYAFIIDKQGRIIAMPPKGYLDFGFSQEEIASGDTINQSILEKISIELFSPLAEMAIGRNDIRVIEINGIENYLAHQYIPEAGYSLGIIVPVHEMQTLFLQTNEVLARQNQQTILNVGIIILIVLTLSLFATIFIGNQLTYPLVHLTQTANKIASGDLGTKADVSTHDEIGVLSDTINSMTSTLEGMITTLEQRVNERTLDLSRRASQLEAVAEVARDITSIQNIDALLPAITHLISRKFGYYHCGVFLTDENKKNQILKASSSEGGKIMLERGHKLPMDEHSIVGYTAFLGEPRIALDVGIDRVFFNNPDLPGTRSEMALPLRVSKDIIGVLDVQSTETGAFLEDDIYTLGTLADQIAIAIQNAQLLFKSQQSLNKSNEIFKRYISNEWKEYPEQLENIGYTFEGGQVFPTNKMSNLNKINNLEIAENKEGNNNLLDGKDSSISYPIRIHSQDVGAISIQPIVGERNWSEEDLILIKMVADRAAIALENARLLDITLRRASKEQAITNITTKIGSSIDIQNILRTAVEELGQTISASTVSIYLQEDD